MEKRAYIIDILRGLAILGMVLSGQMLWHADLPAWLFHAQLPPPTFAFNPEVPGITWVDLVFPFFLFSMGAAFPLALNRQVIEQGRSDLSIVGGVVRRWVLLALFAITLGNLRIGGWPGVPAWGAALVGLVEWGCFALLFLRFERFSKRTVRYLRGAALVGLVALALLCHLLWGVELSLHKSDIIILILSNMVLFGSLAWFYTRKQPMVRLALLALLVALRLGSEVEGSWNEALWAWSPASWLFRFDYLKYLCIVLPATFAGEKIDEWLRSRDEAPQSLSKGREGWICALLLGLIVLNLWGLFTRHLVAVVVGSIALGWLICRLQRKGNSPSERLRRALFKQGLFWLLLGLFCEAFEGGIRKDFATFSYFFVTSGLALAVLTACSALMERFGWRFRPLIECGQNPMVAYTAAEGVIMPTLTLLQLAPLVSHLSGLGPWCGFLRGVVMCLLVMLLAGWATRKRLFWRT